MIELAVFGILLFLTPIGIYIREVGSKNLSESSMFEWMLHKDEKQKNLIQACILSGPIFILAGIFMMF